jgi:hypothetical protein
MKKSKPYAIAGRKVLAVGVLLGTGAVAVLPSVGQAGQAPRSGEQVLERLETLRNRFAEVDRKQSDPTTAEIAKHTIVSQRWCNSCG